MEQADAWMSKQESFLDSEDYGDSLDSVEAMTKKQEDFEKSLLAQEEKIKALDEFATKLIGNWSKFTFFKIHIFPFFKIDIFLFICFLKESNLFFGFGKKTF